MQGPLRVAIAGRVKAGKSTLLNALVGERLAPTDAGECTRIVSWYRKGTSYQVSARLRDGRDQPLTFKRDEGALDVQLGGLTERDVRWLDVRWPASTLDTLTLIDTPGIASLNDENSRRTREFLDPERGRQRRRRRRDLPDAPRARRRRRLPRRVHGSLRRRRLAGQRRRRAVAGRRDRCRPARRDGLGAADRRPLPSDPQIRGAVRLGHADGRVCSPRPA